MAAFDKQNALQRERLTALTGGVAVSFFVGQQANITKGLTLGVAPLTGVHLTRIHSLPYHKTY